MPFFQILLNLIEQCLLRIFLLGRFEYVHAYLARSFENDVSCSLLEYEAALHLMKYRREKNVKMVA